MNKNKIKNILVILNVILIILAPILSLADTVEIGDTLYVERGDLGFYTIQYWNEKKEKWMYITYSRTYYTDKNGQKKIAYCMDQDLDGVGWLPDEVEGYDTEVKYRLDDERIWKILKNGYPNVSYSQLGVETEDDAYLATKQAIYWVIKNKPLSDIYANLRAGQTELNEQNLVDIQRRGKKVVDAIYKLVDIAYNQKYNLEKPKIIEITEFEQDTNKEYYSKQYMVTNTGLKSKIKIKQINSNSRYDFVADEKGQAKTEFSPGEKFKIMVPKDKISGDYTIKVQIEKEMESYPIYYAASKEEGKQNYVILLDSLEKEEEEISFRVKGYQSQVKIIKTDEETGKPISGAKFEIGFDYGVKMGVITTDKNGIAYFDRLHQGPIYVKEIETNEQYILDNEKITFNLGYDELYILNVKNKHKKGDILIEKVDKDDNNIHIDGVEFELINADGEIVSHMVTDKDGKAEAKINIGEYTLREVKTKQEYKIGVEQNVKINWNEKLELKIENEKKKGQIKIIKCDEENRNIKLEGVKFEILDKDEKKIEDLVTNEQGEAVSSKLVIGKYYVKETKTQENYILDSESKEIQVKENEITEIIVDNQRIKGQIQINKISEDKNNILNKEKGSPIANTKFHIYNEKMQLVDEIVTNEQGIALSKKLDKGKYTIQEIEASKWYILNEEQYNVEINKNNEIVEIDITNKSKNPMVEIDKQCKNVVKSNAEIDYSFVIKNTGNTDLDEFIWYDILPDEYAKITKIETGTYNQDIKYNIYYKTNLKNEYMIVKKDLSSKENTYVDLSNIHLEKDEKIIEIKIYFGKVDTGFSSIESPHIFMKTNEDLQNDTQILNYTKLEGIYQEYKIKDEDTALCQVHNIVEQKKLPRTGY